MLSTFGEKTTLSDNQQSFVRNLIIEYVCIYLTRFC